MKEGRVKSLHLLLPLGAGQHLSGRDPLSPWNFSGLSIRQAVALPPLRSEQLLDVADNARLDSLLVLYHSRTSVKERYKSGRDVSVVLLAWRPVIGTIFTETVHAAPKIVSSSVCTSFGPIKFTPFDQGLWSSNNTGHRAHCHLIAAVWSDS